MIRMKKTMPNGDLAVISFEYRETCHNVYKHFGVERNDKVSNMVWLKKCLNGDIPSIISANTYFWHPNTSASSRRYTEKKRESEVQFYFEKNGFTII